MGDAKLLAEALKDQNKDYRFRVMGLGFRV